MSNDPRTPAGTNYKNDGQPDSSLNREEESIEDSMTPDDKMGNDLHLHSIILKRESKESDISINRKDGSV